MSTSSAEQLQELAVASDADVVRVRQAVRALALKAALSIVDQTKIVTAASELARNTLIHGGGGTASVELVADGRRNGVRATFVDTGPGIADLQSAMAGGNSTRGGLGMGLSGSRRLVDVFELDTNPGRGTRVSVTKWKR
ncbi:MAG: serine/threonine-protein kinase RsbT [Candidatus Eremiobacteraeota bacterium]|nr:serine/threonine-protein kinase RsbT [Candidatus Eremiobacteraeota bacterium]MEA2720425.1 serine/threonine-protein kinase RsbT [Candidatus Eremiobacteraeota bacterium]